MRSIPAQSWVVRWKRAPIDNTKGMTSTSFSKVFKQYSITCSNPSGDFKREKSEFCSKPSAACFTAIDMFHPKMWIFVLFFLALIDATMMHHFVFSNAPAWLVSTSCSSQQTPGYHRNGLRPRLKIGSDQSLLPCFFFLVYRSRQITRRRTHRSPTD